MSTRFRAITITGIVTFIYLTLASRVINLNFLVPGQGEVVEQILSSLLVSVLLFAGCLWVLFFKRKGLSYVTIGLYPSFALFPYVLLTISSLGSIFAGLERLTAAVIAAGIFGLICYLLLLTANVLNGAVLFNIPLGQAGKAAQFIFALISSYLLLVFVFGSPYSIIYRLIAICLFTFYFTFSALWALQVSSKQLYLSSISITILLAFVVMLLSIWPISAVLATVVAVIFLYICLNVALEVREKVSYMVWVEYFLLVVLALFILSTFSMWGINGALV